jgi:hypothetical protein
VIGGWILPCYRSGVFGSIESLPTYTSPSLAEVIKSVFSWQMVIYGATDEERFADSDDAEIKRIWDGKIVAEYASIPNVSEMDYDIFQLFHYFIGSLIVYIGEIQC